MLSARRAKSLLHNALSPTAPAIKHQCKCKLFYFVLKLGPAGAPPIAVGGPRYCKFNKFTQAAIDHLLLLARVVVHNSSLNIIAGTL